MDEQAEHTNGNGHAEPVEDETMMAAVVAIPHPDENKLTYELRLNPQMTVPEQIDFSIMLSAMAANSAARLRKQERMMPQIKAATLSDLPPDLKLPGMGHPGRRGKGRG